ncbi:MAG TPA: TIGR04222 domain-containing membrane protein, partial [Thermosynechococcaceae cyanobacterium]
MVEFKQFASLGFDTEQAALYQRLQEFLFDRPDTSLSFSQRLARENNWSLEFAERAIAEYKRFAFLAVVAGHPVTPSDQVDQVWHLHLTYTRSYWEEFCTQVLQRPLHHEPTRGGQAEGQKFDEWYGKTLESYQHWFGEFPPVELWPLPSDRFGRDLNFIRVNTQQNWVLSKPTLNVSRNVPSLRLVLPALLFCSLVMSLGGCQGLPDPMDFSGTEFLTLYIVLSAVILPVAHWLRNYLRQPDSDPRRPFLKLNDYETAYLAGGARRAVGTAIASLVQRRSVKVLPSGVLSLEQPVNLSWHSVEQTVAIA